MSKRKNKKKKSNGIIILVAVLCLIGVLGFAVTQGGLLGKIQDNIVNNFIEQKSYRLTCGDTVIPMKGHFMDIATEEAVSFEVGGAFSEGYSVMVDVYVDANDASSPYFNYTLNSSVSNSVSNVNDVTKSFEIYTQNDYFIFKIPLHTTVVSVLEDYEGVEGITIEGDNDKFISNGYYNFCIIVFNSDKSVSFVVPFRIATYIPDNVTITEPEVFIV